jgi:hypothetical protein
MNSSKTTTSIRRQCKRRLGAPRPAGTSWPNPFAAQARMLAVNSGMADAGKWVTHKRNVREDLKAAFGEDFTEIHVVAAGANVVW